MAQDFLSREAKGHRFDVSGAIPPHWEETYYAEILRRNCSCHRAIEFRWSGVQNDRRKEVPNGPR